MEYYTTHDTAYARSGFGANDEGAQLGLTKLEHVSALIAGCTSVHNVPARNDGTAENEEYAARLADQIVWFAAHVLDACDRYRQKLWYELHKNKKPMDD